MKRKTIQSGLLVLALTLVLCTGVKPALAYFTDTASAAGSVPLNLGYTTTIDESVKDLTKTLTIQNTGDTAVYVRARAYVGGEYELTVAGDGWTAGDDGWYVFGSPVAPGQFANDLTVTVSKVPAALADGDSFNVAVVYESTPVQYHEDGTPYADWTITLDTGTSASGGTEGG